MKNDNLTRVLTVNSIREARKKLTDTMDSSIKEFEKETGIPVISIRLEATDNLGGRAAACVIEDVL